MIGLVILTDIFVLIPVLSESFIRTVLGLPLVLFLPGYALVALLFPANNGLEGIERAALSVGMSVATVPLIGLVLNNTSFGIREMPLLASLSLLIILTCAAAYVRRRQLPEDKAFGVSFKASAHSLLVEILGKPESSTEKNPPGFSGDFCYGFSWKPGLCIYNPTRTGTIYRVLYSRTR
ncbi:DUF1616 domain-containing protein [Methanosarcina horonobensis]|uniref:DUF1616 domain-containing protein n=1 Tax=Methanosarcina horonobensis TaxID=418008 RepID=UPI000A8BEA73